MAAKLVFFRQVQLQGMMPDGEIFFSINGKSVGRLANTDCVVEVPAGRYEIQMYKTHFNGSMVGFASSAVELQEGEALLVRYHLPAVASQNGNITFHPYDPAQADAMAWQFINQMQAYQQQQRVQMHYQQSRGSGTVAWIIVGFFVMCLISWLSYFMIFNL